MTHPLTDDIIESELATPAHFTSGSLVGLFTHDDMRAAADWQLEQVIEWVKHCRGYRLELASETWNFVQDLKAAMRPQEDNQ